MNLAAGYCTASVYCLLCFGDFLDLGDFEDLADFGGFSGLGEFLGFGDFYLDLISMILGGFYFSLDCDLDLTRSGAFRLREGTLIWMIRGFNEMRLMK